MLLRHQFYNLYSQQARVVCKTWQLVGLGLKIVLTYLSQVNVTMNHFGDIDLEI
jgi:hypothetical protein